jgi:type I restriction enzyme S subunit
MEYKRLGDYIREVNVRNKDLKVTKLVGLTIDKAFIPSVANVIGTDLSNYKVIRKEQFACSLMQVSRDGKMPVAMFEEDAAIMSPAYPMFEVIDKKTLLPQYLMMWFSRSEFDREASYYAVGGVRGSLTWEDFCNMKFPVPSIDRQREIVEEYETLSRRIRLNEQMIEKLEATAQALYRKMFVDGIDKENLPEGWRMGMLGDVVDIKGGKRLPKGEELQSEKNTHPYIKVADMCTFKYMILNDKFQYVEDEVQNQIKHYIVKTNDVILSIVGTIGNVNVIDESLDRANLTENCVKLINIRAVSCHYVYSYLTSVEGKLAIDQSIVGGVQGKLPIYNIEKLPLLIPSKESIEEFDAIVGLIDNESRLRQKENSKLSELQSLLLAKMGRLKQ